MTRRTSLSGHHSATPKSVIWLTPPEIITALGGPDAFDLDPCAPFRSKLPTARRVYSYVFQDGLAAPWFGRVWLNPPFTTGVVGRWLFRLAEHGNGTALISARTETAAFQAQVFGRASALLFLAGRYHFHHLNGARAKADSGAPLVLCAYGEEDADRLLDCGLPGKFTPLHLPRFFAVITTSPSWRAAVSAWLSLQPGPVRVDEVYRAFADHPKARRNRHWRAKIRQTLQRGAGRRVARDRWEAAA